MKIPGYLLGGTLLLFGAGALFAMPAKKGVRTFVQPDGSVLSIKVTGDEAMHFVTTEDGRLLHLDDDGFYRLAAVADDGAIVSTGESVNKLGEAIPHGIKLTEDVIKDVKARREQKGKKGRRKLPVQSGMGLFSSSYPLTGNPKCLIILVEYSDVKFNTAYDAKSYFTYMINGDDFTQFGGTGSVLKYFKDQSGGKFAPSFDIYGPVTLPRNMSYYGKNDRYGEDQNAEQMVVDAVNILDATVDFSQYDTTGDGFVDNVYIFYAGRGEADSYIEDAVWPHSWDLTKSGIIKKADGVQFDRYACSNEWSEDKPDGIGTFVHEFSHVLGIPDLYTTTSVGDYTPGEYSVMDYGPYNNDSRTPPNYSAYEKNAMGWYEPIMLEQPMSVTLHSIESGEFGMVTTEKETEFFLFENRQLEGWDAYIPNHGMLIWHIDYDEEIFEENIVNEFKYHQYVDIVEANNWTGYEYMDGYTFPGTSGNTSFTADTKPAFKSWAGKAIDYPITNIKEEDGIITFDVAGGGTMSAPLLKAEEDSEVEYYNLQGMRISNPTPGALVVRKQGQTVTKMIFN